jgi:hypothetical protein
VKGPCRKPWRLRGTRDRSTGMATTKYCYDGTDLIYEEDDDGAHREYYHGPEGLLSMYDSASGGSRRYHSCGGMSAFCRHASHARHVSRSA